MQGTVFAHAAHRKAHLEIAESRSTAYTYIFSPRDCSTPIASAWPMPGWDYGGLRNMKLEAMSFTISISMDDKHDSESGLQNVIPRSSPDPFDMIFLPDGWSMEKDLNWPLSGYLLSQTTCRVNEFFQCPRASCPTSPTRIGPRSGFLHFLDCRLLANWWSRSLHGNYLLNRLRTLMPNGLSGWMVTTQHSPFQDTPEHPKDHDLERPTFAKLPYIYICLHNIWVTNKIIVILT